MGVSKGRRLDRSGRSPDLSIVIPAYNEQARLLPTLERITRYFGGRGLDYEVVVVDDGSRDQTLEIARQFAAQDRRIKVLHNVRNRGKGGAVRRGVAAARGRLVLFTDSDLSTPIEEFEKLNARLEADDRLGVVIASRAVPGAELVQHQPWYREVMGKTFNLLVRWLVLSGVRDTQCGFKLYRRDVARSAFRKMTILGFGFDVEVLYLARKGGARIEEVPVIWANALGSKVSPLRDSLRMFGDLLRIRLRHG
jgi:dolichyl-phosphate beta-glucosyltransferase